MEFSVGIDVGARSHHIAILDPDGELSESFEIAHQQSGFDQFFSRLSHHQRQCGKPARHVNKLAQVTMLIATDRHRHFCPESQTYYQKKRSEGKTHNQTLRALAQHLIRVIYQMLTHNRDYELKNLLAKPHVSCATIYAVSVYLPALVAPAQVLGSFGYRLP